MTRNDLLNPCTEQPPFSDMMAQARASLAGGNIPDAFRGYRQAVAAAISLNDDEIAALAGDLASVVPQYLAQGHAADAEAFLNALRIHPNLAYQFAHAVEKHAAQTAPPPNELALEATAA